VPGAEPLGASGISCVELNNDVRLFFSQLKR
jgi:hypothetical protein